VKDYTVEAAFMQGFAQKMKNKTKTKTMESKDVKCWETRQ
jgi:hypothetical protein